MWTVSDTFAVDAADLCTTLLEHFKTLVPEDLFDEATLSGAEVDEEQDGDRYDECLASFVKRAKLHPREISVTQWFRVP